MARQPSEFRVSLVGSIPDFSRAFQQAERSAQRIRREAEVVPVSCTVDHGDAPCSWQHYEVVGTRFYLGRARIPERLYRAINRLLRVVR